MNSDHPHLSLSIEKMVAVDVNEQHEFEEVLSVDEGLQLLI